MDTRLLTSIFFVGFFSAISISIIAQSTQDSDLLTAFEKDENYTATYHEAIAYYQMLASRYDHITINEAGETDSGYPLHEVILSNDLENMNDNRKVTIMINNAIHPGEPCGVDASMMFARDLLSKNEYLLDHVNVVIIPVYNISGSLNRGSFSRANQQGPQAYGFRGNAQNLDLNRDFIKCDTKNARSFNHLFTSWNPHILIDNHTSNGADYQYVMTLIPTQKDKLDETLSTYLTTSMLPDLFNKMEEKNYEMTPYVYVSNTPDDGIAGFLDYPRYSSGYASLHNCISFMPETHMLKPFSDRVKSTHRFLESMIEHVHNNYENIIQNKQIADRNTMSKTVYDLDWKMDMERVDTILFKGYTAKYKPSEISAIDRLYYDHDEPYHKAIPHFNSYKSSLSVEKPIAYIIPQAYEQIVDRMKANNVQFSRLKEDKIYNVEIYSISDYKTRNAYEGHYLHYNTEVESSYLPIQYHKGDYIVYTDQKSNNYIISTLEPQAPDSWFAWNFFDGILMQKEHFSPYVFEDLASAFLEDNPQIKQELQQKKNEDPEFAQNGYAQLNFVYERSPHYEPTYKRYPVGRLMTNQ